MFRILCLVNNWFVQTDWTEKQARLVPLTFGVKNPTTNNTKESEDNYEVSNPTTINTIESKDNYN